MIFAPRILICAILLFSALEAGAAEQMAGGLLFVGDHPGFKWGTTLYLSSDSNIALPAKMSLQFDFAVWQSRQYGTILCFNFAAGKSLMLTLVPDSLGDSSSVALAWHGGRNEVKATLARQVLVRGRWHSCQLLTDFQAGTAALKVDSLPTRCLQFAPLESSSADIRFGYESLQREGALFALRNLRLSESDGASSEKLLHWWPLQESEGAEVRDRVGGLSGWQVHGQWLLPSHTRWTPEREFGPIVDSTARFLFDRTRERYLVVSRDTLYAFSRRDLSISREPFVTPHVGRFHKVLYDERRNRLYTFHDGGGRVTEYSFERRTWPAIDSSTEYNEHNYGSATWVDPGSGDLFMFGGYGWYTLKNAFYRYDFDAGNWVPFAVDGDTIAPRMGPASALDDMGRAYIAGGSGNSTGKQETGLTQFFDLWQFNPHDRTTRRLWASSRMLGDCIEGVSPWIGDSSIFLLTRSDYTIENSEVQELTLYEYPTLQKLVTLRVSPRYQKAQLLIDPSQSQLILALEFLVDRNKYSFKTFTLEYPPVPDAALATAEEKNAHWKPPVLAVIVLATGTIVIGWVSWKRTRRKNGGMQERAGSTAAIGSSAGTKVRIELLGGFHLHDAQGKDLVEQMRRQVAQIFMVLLTYSVPGRGGVGAERLQGLFWPNIDPKSARNSRNVAIKHLRDVLAKVGITILFDDDRYSLQLPDHLECDYYRLLDVLSRITENQGRMPDALIHEFLALAGKGQLLPGKDHPWLEGVRTDLMGDVARAAGLLLKAAGPGNSDGAVIEIADVALLWDPLNEAAMRAKLKRLTSDGLHSQAKAEFERFTATYQSAFKHPFPSSLQAFLVE
jgi:DNA-binding SARP family transcriptional activator